MPIDIAGDFNRRFRQLNFEGSVWEVMNGVDPEQDEEIETPVLVAHPISTTRKCSTRKGRSTQPIDWIVIDDTISDTFVAGSFWETRWDAVDVGAAQNGRGLSDHCPISIKLDFQ